MLQARAELGLQARRQPEQPRPLIGAERAQVKKVALGARPAPFARRTRGMRGPALCPALRHRVAVGVEADAAAGAAESARAIILSPASASSRVSVSAGKSRSTFSAVALTSSRSRRQASTALLAPPGGPGPRIRA